MRLCCRHRAPQHKGKGAKVCDGLGQTACSRRSQAGSEASWLRWGMAGSGGSLCGSLVGSVSRSWWARGAGFSVRASCSLVPSEYGPTTCTYAAVPGSSARRSAQHTARARSTMRSYQYACNVWRYPHRAGYHAVVRWPSVETPIFHGRIRLYRLLMDIPAGRRSRMQCPAKCT